MAKKEESKEIAPKAETAVAAITEIDYSDYAGAGTELVDSQSIAIPFLLVLQGLSPQIETVDGAKPGKILNSITNEIFDSVLIVPIYYQRGYVRWAPRATGGGFKGNYSPAEIEAGVYDVNGNSKEIAGLRKINGEYWFDVPADATPYDDKGQAKFDKLSDTRVHFVMFRNNEGIWEQAVLSLSSTQIKKSKRLNSLIDARRIVVNKGGREQLIKPPSWAFSYEVSTLKEKNAKGEWWGISFANGQRIADKDFFDSCCKFYELIKGGSVVVTPPESEHFEGAEGAEAGEVNKF